jgi:hypothetical protein
VELFLSLEEMILSWGGIWRGVGGFVAEEYRVESIVGALGEGGYCEACGGKGRG